MPKQTKLENLKFAILATDVVLFTIKDNQLLVRLIEVDTPPYFRNILGLPGGLIKPMETAEDSVKRLLKDKSNIDIKKIYIEQLYTFSEVNRDPRGRVVAVAYLALVSWDALTENEKNNTSTAKWITFNLKTKLAYDHNEILKTAYKRLSSRITYTTLIKYFLPKEFTLTELENTYANILGLNFDKRNFRKKIIKLDILTSLPTKKRTGRFRPAKLYKFKSNSIKEIEII